MKDIIECCICHKLRHKSYINHVSYCAVLFAVCDICSDKYPSHVIVRLLELDRRIAEKEKENQTLKGN